VAAWVHTRDAAGRVLALPSQTPGILARTGLTRAQAARSAWAIDRSGQRYAGAGAINRVVAELNDPFWPALAKLYRLPPLRLGEERIYYWVAVHRGLFSRWGTTPACQLPGAACEPER